MENLKPLQLKELSLLSVKILRVIELKALLLMRSPSRCTNIVMSDYTTYHRQYNARKNRIKLNYNF